MQAMLVQLVLHSLGVQGWETLVFFGVSGFKLPGNGLLRRMRLRSSSTSQARDSCAMSAGFTVSPIAAW